MDPDTPQVRSRKRRALACELCRQRKIRCDRTRPCSNCRRSKTEVCRYVTGHPNPEANAPPETTVARAKAGNNTGSLSSDASTLTPGTWQSSEFGSAFICNGPSTQPTPSQSAGEVIVSSPESRIERIVQEGQPGQAESHASTSGEPGPTSWILSLRKSATPIRHIMSKNRYIGQSHWMTTAALVPAAVRFLENEFRNRTMCWSIVQECKTLAKTVKSQRLPKTMTLHGHHNSSFPAKHLADQLVDAYLRTFETFYRILHVPTFQQGYKRVWLQGLDVANPAFLTQLRLCMAIGACFSDDSFSLRTQCTQWIFEALAWLSPSAEKSNMSLFGLQTMCLLHLARQTTGLGGEVVWISAGSLLHMAVCMGLHVDPSKLPKMSTLELEMRRRLWGTVLELVLQSSLEAGTSPMIDLTEFSCMLPSNYNDSQLGDANERISPAPLPVDRFTDSTMHIALARSFSIRLKIAQVANGIGDNLSYEDTSRLSSDLAAAQLELQTCLNRTDWDSSVSLFQRRFCDVMVRRYFLVLHLPFASLDISHPPFYLSRRICIDTAIQLSYFALHHSSPAVQKSPLSSLFTTTKMADQCDDYVRLLLCGSGPLQSVHMQCLMITASALTREPSNALIPPTHAVTGSIARNLELEMLFRSGVEWTERRIHAGQTNVKDHLFAVILLAHIKAPTQSVAVDVFAQERSITALRSCKRILRELAGPESTALGVDSEAEDAGLRGIDGFLTNELSDIDWDVLVRIQNS
ncbi:hypothetical protein B0T10DRAFT_451934 [Thelonectria olida]|uniref:Zn(2)-C6 fungal-type domain-containing protein n=1 Tax=Thelonectria olida TaxID=1576542 RepID=A0A9P8VLL8_9HYPO|nr:hypothetical protein B0T10DRAFT_451934 [Thelonectria olida]